MRETRVIWSLLKWQRNNARDTDPPKKVRGNAGTQPPPVRGHCLVRHACILCTVRHTCICAHNRRDESILITSSPSPQPNTAAATGTLKREKGIFLERAMCPTPTNTSTTWHTVTHIHTHTKKNRLLTLAMSMSTSVNPFLPFLGYYKYHVDQGPDAGELTQNNLNFLTHDVVNGKGKHTCTTPP